MHARFSGRNVALAAAALAFASMSSHAARSAAPKSPAPLEDAILTEVNLMRADPAGYARFLEATRAQYQGNLFVRGHGLAPIKTTEGVAAVDEAIEALKTAPALGSLSSSVGLASAARDHVRDEGPTGVVGHKGTDGSNSWQRIQRHGKTAGLSGEVIDYGWTSAREIVMDLLVDDGIANRGHRKALLRALYAQAGVACGNHARFGVMCVMDMAESFTPSDASSDEATVIAAATTTTATTTAITTSGGAR